MIVSLANSVRFIIEDGLDPSFDNTLFNDEVFKNNPQRSYCQKFLAGDYVAIQIQTDLTEVATLTRYNESSSSVISPTTTTTYSDFKIIDYQINLVADDIFYLVADSDSDDSWKSEPLKVVDRDDMLKIEWYNYDPKMIYEFDYSDDQVNKIYIESLLMDYNPAGEVSIYDNENEKVKIKQSVFRNLDIKTNPIPRYLAEKLQIAMAHDVFVVNDRQYTVEDLEEVESLSDSNIVQVSATLTQRYILAMNTDDLGFNCDSSTICNMVINLEKLNGSGQFEFTATAGYSINQIILNYQDGTGVHVKIGTSVGGEEILRDFTVNESEMDTLDREIALSRSSNTTIYVEVLGTNALVDVNIQTIKYIKE